MEYSPQPVTANQESTRNPKNQIIQPLRGKNQELGEVVPPKKPPNTDEPFKSLKGLTETLKMRLLLIYPSVNTTYLLKRRAALSMGLQNQ